MENKIIVDIDALFNAIKMAKPEPSKIITRQTVINPDGDESTSEEVQESHEPLEVNGAKYDTINKLLEMLLVSEDEIDASLGFERGMKNSSLGTQVAYNTLKHYKIIKEL